MGWIVLGIGLFVLFLFGFFVHPLKTALNLLQFCLGSVAFISLFAAWMTEFQSPVALTYTAAFGGSWLLMTLARWKIGTS